MAPVHNALDRFTELSRSYRALLGLTEAGGLERAGETLTPVYPLFELPEASLQRGELLATVYHSVGAGGAGTYAAMAVYVRDTANAMAIIHPSSRPVTVAAAVSLANVNVASQATILGSLGGALSIRVRDSRYWATAGAPVVQPMVGVSGTPGAGVGTTIAALMSDSGSGILESMESIGPVILTPGWGIVFQAQAANQALRGTFRMRIRPMQPREGTR